MYTTMPSPTSRKRPAPGANPLPTAPVQQAPQQFANPDQMMRWNGIATNGNNYAEVSNQYMPLPQQQQDPHTQQIYQTQPQSQRPLQSQAPSNVLALRDDGNRALVPTTHSGYDTTADQWATSETALVPATNGRVHEPDPEQQLRDALARARKIEEEATKDNPGPNQKRSIPPFVLKLASFLNNGKNSDLIRWSEKGDSFIVLDEDEFAKKLIPEMFKHNNYASFVRQLNMYGFHKRVGLSDNSMRASEKKNKSPSEYAHQYFRRGYDVLQWLIQKPNKNAAKRKQGAKRDVPEVIEADSDDEYLDEQYAVSGAPGRPLGRNEAGPLAKTEMGKFREQLAEVQQKQQQVLAMIHSLRQNQEQIMQKAHRVEQMHQRHENSITAILNFLANVFRKSLEGKGSAENLSEMLASILPLGAQQGSIPTGVVQDLGDLGEYIQQQNVARNSMSPVPQKRTQHLLPGIPAKHNPAAGSSGRMVSEPPSPADGSATSGHKGPPSARITEVYDTSPSDTTSPHYYRNELQSNPQETMMKIMGATNARMTPGVDLPEVAAATSASMPSDQRNRMLSSMSQRTTSPANVLPPSAFPPPSMPSTIPNTTTMPSDSPASQPSAALSPIINSLPPNPMMDDVSKQQYQLHEIDHTLGEVGDGISNLAQIVGQLSPNGHIPGYETPDGPNGYFPNVDNEFNSWVDLDGPNGVDFGLNDTANNQANNFDVVHDINDFDFGLGGTHDFNSADSEEPLADGLPVPTSVVKDTPSPADTEEIQRSDLDGMEVPSAKRRRHA